MPELPEVETVRRGLAAVWEGRGLAQVELRRPDLRVPFPPDFVRRLEGRRIETVGRRAKYLLVRLDGGLVLLGHLGMSGRMVIGGEGAGPHDHVLFVTDDGTRVVYTDPRRFGMMGLCAGAELDSHPLLAGMGPEPLGDSFTPALLAGLFEGKAQPVKTALLDQRLVAGLGNIYVCESLFRAGISPLRAAGALTRREIGRLVPHIKEVLAEAIEAGGSTLRDHARPDGELGYFQFAFKVYGREGEPCPACGKPIVRTVQGGRSTFHCAKCQR